MSIDDLCEIMLAHLTKRLREVVDDEAIMVGKELVPHLWNLPTWEIEVQSIDERHVVSDDVWHWREKMTCLNHHIDWLIGISKHCDASVPRHRLLAPLERARFAVGFHRRDDFLRHLLEVGN